MRICVTGHRPKLLYGYDLNNEKWQALKEKLKGLLLEENCTEAITGMALGTDQILCSGRSGAKRVWKRHQADLCNSL